MTNETNQELTCRELESLLHTSFGQDVIVESCTAENLLSLGENFTSYMKKVTAKIRQNENSPEEVYHFVTKKNLNLDGIGNWAVMVKREIFFYTDLIPLYAKIELKNGTDETKTIAGMIPKLYGYQIISNSKTNTNEIESIILLENIKTKGYYVLPKKIGLDIQHSRKAIEMLAKFHAIGIVAKKNLPDEFEKLKSVALVPAFYDLHGTEKFRQDFLSKVLRNDDRYNKNIAIIEEIKTRHKYNRNYEMTTNETWSTICHSDYWTNNLLFHKDQDGNVDGMKFVDFQSYCFSNVFTDLCHFLCTSLDDESYSQHFDELIDIYYNEFISVLKNMKVEIDEFNRSKFDEQFCKDACYELIHNLIALLYHTVDADDVKDEKELIELIFSCKGNQIFHKKLERVLKTYEEKNWLQ